MKYEILNTKEGGIILRETSNFYINLIGLGDINLAKENYKRVRKTYAPCLEISHSVSV